MIIQLPHAKKFINSYAMTSTRSDLNEARTQVLVTENPHPWDLRKIAAYVESLAGLFVRVSKDQHRELAAQFHDSAGKLPYFNDCDYGAVVLEDASDSIADEELRMFMLTEARFRAVWCAQSATAGGESIARAQHLKRLNEKIKIASLHQ